MKVLALFHVVAGLQVTVSPNQLYYEMSDASFSRLFSNLDFADSETRLNMVSLFSKWSYEFTEHFENVSFNDGQAQKLVDSFIPYPCHHPLVLPFNLVSNSDTLVKAMEPYWHLYRPGVIYIWDRVPLLSSDQIRIVLSNLLEHPEWCGNRLAATRVSSLFPGWDLRSTESATTESGLFLAIAKRYNNEARTPNATNEYSKEFSELAQEDWPHYYENLLSVLRKSWMGFCDARRALWHGQLLIVALRMAPDKVVKKREIIQEFLLEHTISLIPPMIMNEILVWAALDKTIYYRTENESMLTITKTVHQLYPQCWSLSDDLADHRQVWRSFLRSKVKVLRLTPPRDNDLIKWWGSYRKLSHVLLTSPKVPVVAFSSVTCESIVCLLEEMSSLLWQSIKLEDFHREFIPSVKEDIFWKAFTRTAATNILYRGQLGFPLSELPQWLCAPVRERWDMTTVPILINKNVQPTMVRSHLKCELLNLSI